MKVCFFLQRRFAHIGHALAVHLKKNHKVEEVSAYVSTRNSYDFLVSQNDIVYGNLILDEDIHEEALRNKKIDFEYLKKLERDYGLPNLWPYLHLDRVIMQNQLIRSYPVDRPSVSYESMLKILEGTAKAVTNFLDNEKPDALVISVVGSVGSSLLYHIAKKKGIRTINIDLTRIKNGIAFSEDYRTFSWVDKIFEELQNGKISSYKNEAEEFLRAFRAKPSPYHDQARPDYNNQVQRAANLRFLKPKNFLLSVIWHLKTIVKEIRKKHSDYTDIKIWSEIYDKFMRKIRGLIGYKDLWEEIVPNESFAFYPLHYEPEIAISLYAPHYTNQRELIKQAARALPVGMYLYVKEHPAMVGYRKRAFYKDIKKIPNVRLINPSYYGHRLSKEAKIIITITSTAGWEGALFGKPVITFGDVYYNKLPTVKRCRSFEELPYLVETALAKNDQDEKSLLNYLSALIEDSIKVDYIDLWSKAETDEEILNNDGIKEMARLLAHKINS